jgi:hypothetical protein
MGFKKSSAIMNLGGTVTESAPNTFTEAEIDLPLSTLDRQVFIVTDCVMSEGNITCSPGNEATNNVQVTKTSKTALTSIADPETIGASFVRIMDTGAGTAVWSDRHPGDSFSTGSDRDYIAIIATPQWYIATVSINSPTVKTASARLTGFVAVADASTYAALVTEELNN